MADRTELIPLGGSQQRSDQVSLVETITNYIPVPVAPYIGANKQLRLMKRRGVQSSVTTAASTFAISAATIWTGVPGTGASPNTTRGTIIYSASDSGFTSTRLYKYDSSVSTLGTFVSSAGGYVCIGLQETLISGTAAITANIKTSIAPPYMQKVLYYPNAGTLAEVTSAPFTSTIGCGVHLDGYYFCASTDGTIKNTDLNSVSSVGANNSIAVQMEPDNLVGLAKLRNIIVAFGTKSIEFFQNAGLSSGSPLQRIPQAPLKMGALHGRALQELGENILFVSATPEGVAVHILEGYSAKKISTPFIDNALSAAVGTSGFDTPVSGGITLANGTGTGFLGVTKQQGVDFAVLCINAATNAGRLYGYSPALDAWITFQFFDGNTLIPGGFFQIGPQRFVHTTARILWQDDAQNPTTTGYDYSASTFVAKIQTVPMTHGTARKKYYKSARLIGNLEISSTPVTLSYSDDNASTFTVAGTFDQADNPPSVITRLGASRSRVWQLSTASQGGSVIDGLELVYEVGPT